MLALKLPPFDREATLGEALAAAHAITNKWDRCRALAVLAPQLTPALLDGALNAILAIPDKGVCAWGLAALAPHLPPELLAEALAAARAITCEVARSFTLAALAPHLTRADQSTVVCEVFDCIPFLDRATALERLTVLVRCIVETDGISALRETRRAIIDVSRWYP